VLVLRSLPRLGFCNGGQGSDPQIRYCGYTRNVRTNQKNICVLYQLIGIFVKTFKNMAKNTTILLGEYFNNFINQQIRSGKFATASEVMRAALRLFEYEQSKKSELIKELKKGEESGFVKDFDRAVFLESIREKHLT